MSQLILIVYILMGRHWFQAICRYTHTHTHTHTYIVPGGADGKEFACNVGDLCSVPGLGRSPGEGNSNPIQYPCLENSTDRGAWQATVHGVTVLDTTERLTHTYQSFINVTLTLTG